MTRGIAKRLDGQRFGHLVVACRAGKDAQNNALWSCLCDCGNVAVVRSNFLGKRQQFCSKQCRLYRRTRLRNIAGKTFGRLVAVRHVGFSDDGKAIWRFRCSCGNEIETLSDQVIQRRTTSCGCGRTTHGKSRTREYHREAHRKWAAANPDKVIENAYRRKRHVQKRTPFALTADHRSEIKSLYRECRRLTIETGVKHHVDHIVPLVGKTVSGLHVPWNLQILSAEINLRKASKLLDDIC